MQEVSVTRWPHAQQPTAAMLRDIYAAEGVTPYRWSNGPHDKYSAHTHHYHKVIFVVQGSITFGLPERAEAVTLFPGDCLDLAAGVLHEALVGEAGVVCLEGHIK